jgi:deoxyribose-phosphate aldolase
VLLALDTLEFQRLVNEISAPVLARRAPERRLRGRIDPALCALIDHTILKPEATAQDVARICREALEYGFASVCVNPCWVPLAAAELQGSGIPVCTVVGFPLGATSTPGKMAETEIAVRTGAREIDMVINVGALRSGDCVSVQRDIEGVVKVAHAAGALVKVILENALLNDDEKVTACRLVQAAGAEFVKTSTGFGPSGATVADVALMRRTVSAAMGVKAAGGIRAFEDLRAMVLAGATRIGASASVKIVEAAATL